MRTVENIRRFRLSDSFIEPQNRGPLGSVLLHLRYVCQKIKWRAQPQAPKNGGILVVEHWGYVDIQKNTLSDLALNGTIKKHSASKDAFDRLFSKWTPPAAAYGWWAQSS